MNERRACQLPRLHDPSATFRHVCTVVDTYAPRNTSIGQLTASSDSSHDQQPYTTTPTTAPTLQQSGRTLPSPTSTTYLSGNRRHRSSTTATARTLQQYGRTLPSPTSTTYLPGNRRHRSSTTAFITSTTTWLVKRTASPVGLWRRSRVCLPLAQLLALI